MYHPLPMVIIGLSAEFSKNKPWPETVAVLGVKLFLMGV